MALNLAAITPTKQILPPRLVLYGPPKIGKTTFAASIPHNLLLDFEEGSGNQSVARVAKTDIDDFDKVLAVLFQLYTDPHNFQCLTVDTVDWLEAVVFERAAKEHGKVAITDVDYGKGYGTAQNLWKQILDGFDALRKERGMMILLLAHEQIRRYDDPMTESYDRYTLKLHDKDKGSSTASLFKEWSDGILFVNSPTFVRKEDVGFNKKVKKAATTNEQPVIHTQERPSFVAGNRFGLPAEIPFTWDALNEALTTALTKGD